MQILIARDAEQFGPYTAEEVRDYLAEGTILRTDLAWHDGLPEWVTVDQVELDCPPERTPPPPGKLAPKPASTGALTPWTGIGNPDGAVAGSSLLNGFIIIPANITGDLTREIAAQLLNQQLAVPRVRQIAFAEDGIERAKADGLLTEAPDFELFGAYDFAFERIGFLHRLAMANEQVHRAEDDKSGRIKTPYFELTTPLPERVEKITGITAGPLGSRMLIAEYATAIAFPSDLAAVLPYVLPGRRDKAAFQRYDDGWRIVGEA